MTPADIDRIVNGEAPIDPSPHFSARVMRMVRAEAAERRARRLAWRQLWPALAMASAVVAVAVASRAVGQNPLSPVYADATLWLAVTMAGTLALASWCTRLVARY